MDATLPDLHDAKPTHSAFESGGVAAYSLDDAGWKMEVPKMARFK